MNKLIKRFKLELVGGVMDGVSMLTELGVEEVPLSIVFSFPGDKINEDEPHTDKVVVMHNRYDFARGNVWNDTIDVQPVTYEFKSLDVDEINLI